MRRKRGERPFDFAVRAVLLEALRGDGFFLVLASGCVGRTPRLAGADEGAGAAWSGAAWPAVALSVCAARYTGDTNATSAVANKRKLRESPTTLFLIIAESCCPGEIHRLLRDYGSVPD
jgi:hypothetical protein